MVVAKVFIGVGHGGSDSGVIIDAEHNRDINKAFAELQNAVINMGGVL